MSCNCVLTVVKHADMLCCVMLGKPSRHLALKMTWLQQDIKALLIFYNWSVFSIADGQCVWIRVIWWAQQCLLLSALAATTDFSLPLSRWALRTTAKRPSASVLVICSCFLGILPGDNPFLSTYISSSSMPRLTDGLTWCSWCLCWTNKQTNKQTIICRFKRQAFSVKYINITSIILVSSCRQTVEFRPKKIHGNSIVRQKNSWISHGLFSRVVHDASPVGLYLWMITVRSATDACYLQHLRPVHHWCTSRVKYSSQMILCDATR